MEDYKEDPIKTDWLIHPYTRALRRQLQEELNRELSLVLTWDSESLKQHQGRIQVLTDVIADVSPEEKA